MEITLCAIGTKMPKWIEQGYQEYARRLGHGYALKLKEIPTPRQSKSQDSDSIRRKEGELLLASVPKTAYTIALDEKGKMQSTRSVANRMLQLHELSRPLALLIGGADGLSDQVRSQSDELWSLSRLTFPHALVRVIVAEQIYRSISLINNHPYHRA